MGESALWLARWYLLPGVRWVPPMGGVGLPGALLGGKPKSQGGWNVFWLQGSPANRKQLPLQKLQRGYLQDLDYMMLHWYPLGRNGPQGSRGGSATFGDQPCARRQECRSTRWR